MPSITARLARRLLRSTLKPVPADERFVDELRTRTGGVRAPAILGRGVGRRMATEDETGGRPGEWVGVPAARRHVLYLHGGYYVAGRPSTYRTLAGRFASGLDADVLLLDYRLAPEHPHPAAVDDALAAYRALLDTGADPIAMAVAGDSAGGGLTLALLLRLKAEGVPLPAAAVLFSPWLDLTCASPSVDRNDEADDLLTAAALRAAAPLYAGDRDPADPQVSPLFGDLAGLPPLFVTFDESETLFDDGERLAERAQAAGTPVVTHRRQGLFHAWPAMVPFVREARDTVADVVHFLDRELR